MGVTGAIQTFVDDLGLVIPERRIGSPIESIDALEAMLLDMPQIECPLVHRFAPGVYLREIFMPAGSFIIGHRHATEHFNVILSGRARVLMDGGEVEVIEAPAVLTSGAGIRKVLYIEADMRWATIHPSTETDVDTLEDILVIKSPAWIVAHSKPKEISV